MLSEVRADISEPPVVVAMSGGVDSSAAALMLAEAGRAVVGVAMQVWDYRQHGGNSQRATCCAPADFDDARAIAERSGFPFYVFDFEESFYRSVISPFVESYLSGVTPNPCLDCNRKVKFFELRRRAAALGADQVATGHYARIRPKTDGSYGLFTARDRRKDQSYFLYALTQADLGSTLFPVGELTKEDVRQYLRRHGFSLAEKEESQDICFVSSSVAEFIERQTGARNGGGELMRSDGTVVGKHQGIHKYTVGQRRGLGVSHSNPLYVLNIDPETNAIEVGERSELERSSFYIRDVNWIGGAPPSRSTVLRVKLRYRHQGVLCRVEPEGTGAKLFFENDWSAVSPGQAAVCYAIDEQDEKQDDGGSEVLGGGIIARDSDICCDGRSE